VHTIDEREVRGRHRVLRFNFEGWEEKGTDDTVNLVQSAPGAELHMNSEQSRRTPGSSASDRNGSMPSTKIFRICSAHTSSSSNRQTMCSSTTEKFERQCQTHVPIQLWGQLVNRSSLQRIHADRFDCRTSHHSCFHCATTTHCHTCDSPTKFEQRTDLLPVQS
jgi:hypothetical protein